MFEVMRLRGAFLALVAGLSISWVAAPPAGALEPGVVSDLTWYLPEADKERTVAATADLGSRWTRLHVQWTEAEPRKGELDEWWIDEYEDAIDRSRAAGQKVILMIYNAPAWASGSPALSTPRDPADFADFAGRLAARFRGKVAGYEIWNEPNLGRFWDDAPDPRAYAALLRAAYPAIRAADPQAKVAFGGLSGNDYRFLEDAYRAGAEGFFDVLATHPYPYCGSSGPREVRRSDDGRVTPDSFTGYRELRASMKAEGDTKPIWVTEFGWNTSARECDPSGGFWQGGVGESEQARYLTRAYQLLERDPYVKNAIWYSLRDPYWLGGSATDPEARTGLLTVDYEPRPAYWAFKSVTSIGDRG
jgi:polysaccharide biosynthesis protein PslG